MRIYLFLEEEGSGPLKSKDRRSNGCVAFTKETPGGLWNRGFTSEHTRHAAIIFRTSLTE